MDYKNYNQTTVTIIGGGSSAHTIIPLLSKGNFKVQLITSKPADWSLTPKLEIDSAEGESASINGRIDRISANYAELIPDSDIILLCMPVSEYNSALNKIALHANLTKPLMIGTVYGQGGFNWMVDHAFRRYDRSNLEYFAIGLLPWICRTKDYGKVGLNYGCKLRNVVAVSNRSKFDSLNRVLLRYLSEVWFNKGQFYLADNFISLTLSVDNQIIHPSRCFRLFEQYAGRWSEEDQIPFFYKDFDQRSADILKQLDDEYSRIRNAIKQVRNESNFDYMLDYLALERFSYGSSNVDIQESFVNSKTLAAIKPPTVKSGNEFRLDTSHRFFTDDIEYGLCIAQWFAQKLGLATPVIDQIVAWARRSSPKLMNYEQGVGLPDSYGIDNLDAALE